MLTIKDLKGIKHPFINDNMYNLLVKKAKDLLYYGYNFNYFYSNTCNKVVKSEAKIIFEKAKNELIKSI